MNNYRYPGLQPFETENAALFYGREREARDLYAQVMVEKMVVLFSKSGMGKSSLLNAGLTPLLQKTPLLPLRIRLSNEAVPLEEQFLQELEKEDVGLGTMDVGQADGVMLDPALRQTGATLWEQVKAAQFRKNGVAATPLFVFDQFEEVFTLYSPARRERFLTELADLANGNPPEAYLQRLRERIGAGERLDVPALESSPRCKFIFSIRADLLHLLNGLSPLIPDLLRSRFELLPLDREQAEEAVTLPAMLRDPERNFLSLPFRYDDAALDTILLYLTKNGAEEVESFQLQILCRAIELQVIGKAARTVTPALFGGQAGLGHIIRDFYMAKIGELPVEQQLPARELLEEQLITDSGRRRSVAEDELPADRSLLDRLVEMRLLRKEPRLRTFYYEISHDTLVEPILEKYKERKMEAEVREAAAQLEAERLENQRIAAETEARISVEKADADRRRRRALITALIAGALVLAAVVAILFAIVKSNEAGVATKKATEAIKEAERQTLAAAASDSSAQVEKNNAGLATQRALEAQKVSDEKTKLAAIARKAADLAEQKAQKAIQQSGIDSENARLAKLEAEQKKRDADAATILAEKAKAEAQLLTLQVVSNLLDQARGDILRLNYDAAFSKMKNAAALGAIQDSVAYELMEIAFFRFQSAQTELAREPFNLAAGLLGKDLSTFEKLTNPSGFAAALRLLDAKRDSFLNARYFPVMLRIPGGSFMMGSPGSIGESDEIPQHKVQLSSFELAKTETTFWQFGLYCAANGLNIQDFAFSGVVNGSHPVVNVTWYDAARYANWLSEREPKGRTSYIFAGDDFEKIDFEAQDYRLPTEAQWEYAARSGGKNEVYAGFSDPDSLYLFANFYDRAGGDKESGQNDGYKYLAQVGSFRANGLGLYDMSGNVWEWCQDWKAPYKPDEQQDPVGPDGGDYRVFRGGSWYNGAQDCRAAYRFNRSPGYRDYDIGFRLSRPF